MTRARDNPFSTDRVLAVRYRPRGWTWDELMSRLTAMNYRAAIVGPEGSGKTTLLEDLAWKLEALGLRPQFLRLDRDQRRFPSDVLRSLRKSIEARDVILLDGCEQMGILAWRRFLWVTRRAGGLIVTVHAPGRLPTLVECSTDVGLLREVAAELSPGVEVGETLFERHRGNIRDAIRELYDAHARTGFKVSPRGEICHSE